MQKEKRKKKQNPNATPTYCKRLDVHMSWNPTARGSAAYARLTSLCGGEHARCVVRVDITNDLGSNLQKVACFERVLCVARKKSQNIV